MGEELTVEVIRQLPLATVAIIACVALWRAYSGAVNAHIETLNKRLEAADKKSHEDVSELRARIMVIEDNLHIQRSERIKYMPQLKMPTSPETKDLD